MAFGRLLGRKATWYLSDRPLAYLGFCGVCCLSYRARYDCSGDLVGTIERNVAREAKDNPLRADTERANRPAFEPPSPISPSWISALFGFLLIAILFCVLIGPPITNMTQYMVVAFFAAMCAGFLGFFVSGNLKATGTLPQSLGGLNIEAVGGTAFFVIVLLAFLTHVPSFSEAVTRVVVIDSYVRRYDQSKQITNADYLKDEAVSVGTTIDKKVQAEHILVGPEWGKFNNVLVEHPDLIVIHMSSFFGSTNARIDPNEFAAAMSEFQTFITYILGNTKKTHILVYTRDVPNEGVWAPETHKLVLDNLAKQTAFLEQRKSRVSLVMLPWDAKFDNPQVKATIDNAIRQALESL
jgi:hypothetical protein